MGLNNVQLSTRLLVDLYATVLVDTIASNMPVQVKTKFLGANAKKILIIITNDDSEFLPDAEFNFLSSVLNSCRLSLDDVVVVNWMNSSDGVNEVTSRFESKIVLLFNLDPIRSGLPINFPQFQIQEFNKITYLHAPSLSDLKENTHLKKQLWNSLKILFQL
jgi:DNA polymerase III psi subunit